MTAQRLATRALATRALATTALAPVLAALLGGAATAGPVLPTGGKVAAGQAVIGKASGSSLSITQSSSKAVIDWTGFSIGSGGKVDFANGAGATLNRVTGSSASALDGLLSATGSLFLINPNGVLIGKNGVVQTGGSFVASTQDLSDTAFLKGGDLTFTGASNAAIVNEGKVGSLGGDVALIAASVTNTGSVAAANGAAGLVSGYSVLMRDASLDNGQFSVLLGGAGTSVTNGGTIAAANAELRAEGGNVYALAGDTAGTIRATGVKSGQGKVWLVADGGTLDVAGTIKAQGAGGSTGTVETSGGTVTVGQASIDAHGGTWTVDPDDLTIDQTGATAIDNALNADTSVVETTSATGTTGINGPGDGTVNPNGNGDILVTSALAWNTTASLTLSAYRNIAVVAPITASGGGALTLITDNSGAGNGGALQITRGQGVIQFTGVSGGQPTGSLFIGSGTAAPTAYTLVTDLATLSADITGNNAGAYALATNVDGGNGGAGYSASPLSSTIATPFAGVLEGLGNTVTNLTINDTTNAYVGLFGQNVGLIKDLVMGTGTVSGSGMVGGLVGHNGAGGVVNNVLSSVSTQGQANSSSLLDLGGLVGSNDGTITGSGVTGSVTDMDTAVATTVGTGGLAGASSGLIQSSDAMGAITSTTDPDSGGAVGFASGGTIANVLASGAVTGAVQTGGLIGVSEATVNNSVAQGAVTGSEFVGGLIGAAIGTVQNSSASGSVNASSANVGGLIGVTGVIFTVNSSISPSGTSESFSQGQGGLATVQDSNASGDVTGQTFVGGLVGFAASQTQIIGTAANLSYATGTVQALPDPNVSGSGSGAGGLVGALGGASVTNSYATGKVDGANNVGGLAGEEGIGVTYDSNGAETDYGSSITGSYATGAVTASQDYVGGLVGAVYGQPITDSYATGNVQGVDSVGGLVGQALFQETNVSNFTPSITGSAPGKTYASGSVTGSGADVGGLVGDNQGTITQASYAPSGSGVSGGSVVGGLVGLTEDGSSVTNSSASGSVAGGDAVGGLVGESLAGVIQDSFATGNVSGGNEVGGLVGFAATNSYGYFETITDYPTISGSSAHTTYASGSVTGTGDAVGGLVGQNQGMISTASYTPSGAGVNGAASVGGLVGQNDSGATVSLATASGSVIGTQAVGGLVGYNYGSVSGSSSSAAVSGSVSVGGLIGANDTDASITGSQASGAVTGASGGQDVGGLVGYNNGMISGGSASGAVNGDAIVGGLAGYNGGTIATQTLSDGTNPSNATGAVTGGLSTGGLVGYNAGSIASGSFSLGAVNGTTYVGGIAGINDATVSGATSTGAVVATGTTTNGVTLAFGGGLAGYNLGSIAASTARGGVTGTGEFNGGLLGGNDQAGSVQTSYATGAVSGSGQIAGGLVGYNDGSVANSYATGAVSAADTVGGLVGYNDTNGTVNATYSTGQVTGGSGATLVGGFAGYDAGMITDGYFDEGGAGTNIGVAGGANAAADNAAGSNAVTAIGGSTGLDPTAQSTYAGFSSSIWTFNPGLEPPTLTANPPPPG